MPWSYPNQGELSVLLVNQGLDFPTTGVGRDSPNFQMCAVLWNHVGLYFEDEVSDKRAAVLFSVYIIRGSTLSETSVLTY